MHGIMNENHWKVLVLMLREIALEKGITHQAIADATGLQRSNVSRLLNLNNCPDLRTFLAVCSALQINFFFMDKEDKTELNQIFERAMEELGRRVDKLPKN